MDVALSLLLVQCPVRKQQVHPPADTMAPGTPFFPFSGTTAMRLATVCTVYIAMSGSEAFYQCFHADIPPASPHGR